MFRPLPTCICNPRCSCDALVRVRGYFLSEQIIRFLRGLNPGFAAVRSQILRTEPLPTINQVFSMIYQEEQELGVSGFHPSGNDAGASSSHGPAADAGSSHVLAIGQQFNRFNRGTKRPSCTLCGLIGHTVDKCYKKIGYPPGYTKRAKVVAVNAVQAPVQAPDSGVSAQNDGSGGVTISHEQYQSLYSLFQGHGSASQALGPSPAFASCVSTSKAEGSKSDAPYVPSSSTLDQLNMDVAASSQSQGSDHFTDGWYS